MNRSEDKHNISGGVRTIIAEVKKYIQKKLELVVLNAGEDISHLAAKSIQRGIGAAFLFLGLSFLLVAGAIYLGRILGVRSLGYVIVSIPLFGIGILFYYIQPEGIKEKLMRRFQKEFVESMSGSKPAEENPGDHTASTEQETTENV